MFTGHIVDPPNPAAVLPSAPLPLGLYINNFVYFLEDPGVERQFKQLLAELVTVEFMGRVDWFLGTHFHWSCSDIEVSIHLSQTGFVAHPVKDSNIHTCNVTPDATPHHSGLPFDTCPESDEANNCPAFLERKRHYQCVVWSIGWLTQSTRPDLTPTHSFLLVYNNNPLKSHLNAALCTLHYIHSMIDYSFTFTSKEHAPLHTQTPRLTPTPYSHHCQPSTIVYPLIVMLAGVLSLVMPSRKAISFRYSNFAA